VVDSHPEAPAGVLVRKYGGSSLADVQRIRTVARSIRRARDLGHAVVVVVSAMGGTTDELADLARQANPVPPRRELDMLLSVGERITMSLLSMALADEGCPAISYTGSQCGIITDTSHTDARILEVRGDRVRDSLAKGYTVVVAGFQGVSREKEITTLGRGGSDTTAVALAAALGAVRCEICKDVDGVMSTDPARVPEAWRYQNLSWDEMQQVAASGCGVVHVRAVEYAARHRVPLVVRSSFHDEPGTDIGSQPSSGSSDESAADRQLRYRPLVMTVVEDVATLRVAIGDGQRGQHWRDLALGQLDPACSIAEWMDSGEGFRWEVVAPCRALVPVRDALVREPTTASDLVDWQEELTCISLAGGRPDSWLEVQRHLAVLLSESGCRKWRLRADGSALRILVAEPYPRQLPHLLHRDLLPG